MKNSIRERREKRGWTQEEMARLAGVTRQTVISLERGRYNPSLDLAFRIAGIFNLRIEDLFSPEGEDV